MRKNIGILMQHWHRRGYLKQESLDDVIAIQRPQKMKSIFDLVKRIAAIMVVAILYFRKKSMGYVRNFHV